MLNTDQIILKYLGTTISSNEEIVQSLWNGYGQIKRLYLKDKDLKSVIIKEITPPINTDHPRGWNTNLSHERKLKSYQVEKTWYKEFASKCTESSRIPKCFGIETNNNKTTILLEDLNSSGYPVRKTSVNWNELKACISWLANFHATYLNTKPTGLWEQGTYWHLNTRPDELEALTDLPLKKVAPLIDLTLKNTTYKTLVHGDAKLANFCFSTNGKDVSAVDFQYVGSGCGMKDLAYLIGSCLNEEECEKQETKILDYYFSEFNKFKTIPELEKEWREMYHYAWADFHRFLKGWSPGHWKINSYSERICKKIIQELT